MDDGKRLMCRNHCRLCRTWLLGHFCYNYFAVFNGQKTMSAPHPGSRTQSLCFIASGLSLSVYSSESGKQGYHANPSLPHSSLPQCFQPHYSNYSRIKKCNSFLRGVCAPSCACSRFQYLGCNISPQWPPRVGRGSGNWNWKEEWKWK